MEPNELKQIIEAWGSAEKLAEIIHVRPRTIYYSLLSGRTYMSCRQAEQPVGGGLNLFLGDPGT